MTGLTALRNGVVMPKSRKVDSVTTENWKPLKDRREQLGLDREVSASTIRIKYLPSLAELCGEDGLTDLVDKKQRARLRPGVRERLKARRSVLVECIHQLESLDRLRSGSGPG